MSEKGIIPPQAVDLEEIVLGAMLVDEKGVLEAMPLLKTDSMFCKSEHQAVFNAIDSLNSKNEAIDLRTVSQELKKLGLYEKSGGDYALVTLTQKVSSSAHIEHHCRILQQYWIKRELIKKYQRLVRDAYNDEVDVFDLLNEDSLINDNISEIISDGANEESYSQTLDKVGDRIELLSSQGENEFTGVPTGFAKINKFTGGWQPGNLVIIAARPGMGKTALALKNVVECGLANIPCGFFSLEMSRMELSARTVAINSNFHLAQIIRDGFKKDKYFERFNHLKSEMKKFPIHIDDRPGLDIRDLINKARVWKRKHDIKILFVDYLQLVNDRTKGNNREQEMASVSRNLKGLAKELNLPVIALSQLSRAVETRGGSKRPKLSDIRESGAIEQDANIVAFIYREHYYDPDAELPDYLTSIGANAEFSFAKYRDGSLETKGLYFDANKVKYMDPEELNNEFVESDSGFITDNLPKPDPNDPDNNPF